MKLKHVFYSAWVMSLALAYGYFYFVKPEA